MENKTDINITIEKTRAWGIAKGITGPAGKATCAAQFEKLTEEVEELNEGLIVDDVNEIVDAIGDCTVVLILMAELAKEKFEGTKFDGYGFEDCLRHAYGVIEGRTGKMVDGVFVKDVKELPLNAI